MFVEGLAEKWQGLNQGLERGRAGVNLLLHDERASERWKNIGRNVGRGLVVLTGISVGGLGLGFGSIEVMQGFGDLATDSLPVLLLKFFVPFIVTAGGMLAGAEITTRMVGLRNRS